MKALSFWVFFAIPTVAFAALPRIGVVVPNEPSLSWMSKQFEIGAELAYNQIAGTRAGFTYEVVRLPVTQGADAAINALTDAVERNNIDVVLAASTADTAHSLKHQPSHWTTPTVVVTPPDPAVFPDGHDHNGYVVELGIPLQPLQFAALDQWLSCYGRDGATVLFNEDYQWSSAFAEHAREQFSQDSVTSLGWSDSTRESTHAEILEKIADKAKRTPDAGIILAGAPWNNEQWITALAKAGVHAPIYVGPLVSNVIEMRELASQSSSVIFAASLYWTDPDSVHQSQFAHAAAEKLGWSLKAPMTPIALKAYDAVALVAHALEQGLIGATTDTNWWTPAASSVHGIKGTLHEYHNAILSPPIELLQFNNDGTFSFSHDLPECPR